MTKWLLIALSVISLVVNGLLITDRQSLSQKNNDLGKSNTELSTKIGTLDSMIKDQDDTIATLHQMAYTKTFNTERELTNWAKEHTPITSTTTYYSEDAVNMVNEARTDGYWMGFVPVNIVGPTAYLPIDGSAHSGGYIVCLAVVDGTVFYMVDPASGTVLKLMTMQAEFKWRTTTTKYNFN